jgi:hypothetical protein
MIKQRKLQIEVKGESELDPQIIDMVLTIDGRNCRIYTSKANYEALIFDGVFSEGNLKDSAVYLEQ